MCDKVRLNIVVKKKYICTIKARIKCSVDSTDPASDCLFNLHSVEVACASVSSWYQTCTEYWPQRIAKDFQTDFMWHRVHINLVRPVQLWRNTYLCRWNNKRWPWMESQTKTLRWLRHAPKPHSSCRIQPVPFKLNCYFKNISKILGQPRLRERRGER